MQWMWPDDEFAEWDFLAIMQKGSGLCTLKKMAFELKLQSCHGCGGVLMWQRNRQPCKVQKAQCLHLMTFSFGKMLLKLVFQTHMEIVRSQLWTVVATKAWKSCWPAGEKCQERSPNFLWFCMTIDNVVRAPLSQGSHACQWWHVQLANEQHWFHGQTCHDKLQWTRTMLQGEDLNSSWVDLC